MQASVRSPGRFAIIVAALAAGVVAASAQTTKPPELHLHQSYIEEVMRPTSLDVKDPMAVFAFVLNSLPDRVKVYPTENYYYFTFTLNGAPYAGNIRLDASDRDQGKVQFGYFEQTTGWRDDTPYWFQVLDASKGVQAREARTLRVPAVLWRQERRVRTQRSLAGARRRRVRWRRSERFIGPIFDDSGIRFFLVYNPAIKNFLYILDETVKVADEFFNERTQRPHRRRQAHRLRVLSRRAGWNGKS